MDPEVTLPRQVMAEHASDGAFTRLRSAECHKKYSLPDRKELQGAPFTIERKECSMALSRPEMAQKLKVIPARTSRAAPASAIIPAAKKL